MPTYISVNSQGIPSPRFIAKSPGDSLNLVFDFELLFQNTISSASVSVNGVGAGDPVIDGKNVGVTVTGGNTDTDYTLVLAAATSNEAKQVAVTLRVDDNSLDSLGQAAQGQEPGNGVIATIGGFEINGSQLVITTNAGSQYAVNLSPFDQSTHAASQSNPHNVTAAQIGLGSVDNTPDVDKPLSNATSAALNDKVSAEPGKGLSEENYTAAEKAKVDNLPANTNTELASKLEQVSLSSNRTAVSVSITTPTGGSNASILQSSPTRAGVFTAANHNKLLPYPILSPPVNGKRYMLEVIGGVYVAKEIYKATESRDNGLINQLTTFEVFSTLNVDVPEDGFYELTWYYEWSYNNANTNFISQIVRDRATDNQVFAQMQQEPPDAGGPGIVLDVAGGGTANTGTDQIAAEPGSLVFNLTAGAHTFELEFAGEQIDNEAAIYRSFLKLETL